MARPFKFTNLSGKRYGKLTVTDKWERRQVDASRRRTFWHVVCDCGKSDTANEHALTGGHKQSCGCLWDSTLEYGVADLRARYRSYKAGAKKREISFDLSISEFQSISSKPCHYCDAEAIERKLRSKVLNGGSIFNGIDRVDTNGPYSLGNCVPCCPRCNYMKKDLLYEEFITQCYQITETMRKKPCCYMASSLPLQ